MPFKAEVDATTLPNHLANCLRDVEASTVAILGNRVVFTRRMFRFVSGWNVLVPFESGDLTVDGRQVSYRVNFRQLVLLGTGVIGLMTISMLSTPGHPPLLVVPLMWLWLVGLNIAIGIVRFERFLDRAMATASPHQAARW